MNTAKFNSLICVTILSWVAIYSLPADGPVFNDNVVSQTTNPDFILDDTDGVAWALEGDEPVANAFSISSNGGGTHVLVIENGAPQNSLRICSTGEIGIGTSSPVGDLNLFDINGSGTAGIRMQETSGTASSWDIRAGSGGFSIEDQTNFTFPFDIAFGAPNLSFSVNSDGDIRMASSLFLIDRKMRSVGIGTTFPEAKLHVRDDFTSPAQIMVENSFGSVQQRSMLELVNNGAPLLFFRDTADGTSWQLNPNSNGNFFINSVGLGGGAEMVINGNNGNTIISGQMRADDFIVTSSRDEKEGFKYINLQDTLAKVIELPILQWRFKDDETKRLHVGPIAEDFEQAFGLGSGDGISAIDVNGIALASIKALKKQHDEESQLAAEDIAMLKFELRQSNDQVARLKAELEELKSMVKQLVSANSAPVSE